MDCSLWRLVGPGLLSVVALGVGCGGGPYEAADLPDGGADNAGGDSGALGSSGESGEGGAGTDCDDLVERAAEQLVEARVCPALASRESCEARVQDLCGCDVSVDLLDSEATLAFLATKAELEERACPVACIAMECQALLGGTCEPSADDPNFGACTPEFE